MDNPSVLVCSSFQHPHFPYRYFDVDRPNIVNTPLPAGTRGSEFRGALERDWLPALDDFKPQLILVSAGFDGHTCDPLGDFLLTEDDFAWVTGLITDAADRHAEITDLIADFVLCISPLSGPREFNAAIAAANKLEREVTRLVEDGMPGLALDFRDVLLGAGYDLAALARCVAVHVEGLRANSSET